MHGVLVVALVAFSSPAAAQQHADVALHLARDVRLVPVRQADAYGTGTTHDATNLRSDLEAVGGRRRVRGALLGTLVGIAAGVGVANAVSDRNCACEDPGLKEAIVGYGVGATIGAGIGAALPSSTIPNCEIQNRLGPGVFGAVAGGAVGFGASALVGAVTGGIGFVTAPLTVVVGSVYGASRSLRRC